LNQKELTKYVMQRPAEEEMAMLSPQVRMALSAIVGDRGGFAIQDVFMDELVKDLAGFAVIRPNARVRQVPGMAALFLTIASGTDPYPSGLSGSWRSPDWLVDGALPPVQNQPTFGRERVPLHMWAPDAVVIPLELLESSAVELEQEIRMLFAETKALDEDSGFINGTGVNSPMGVVTDAANALITTVNSGAANGQSYTGILDLYTALPAQYRMRARWLMNSLTYGLLLQLETTGGMVLFPPNTLPNTLWTRPVDFSEFMPDGNADGNHAVIFGDWSHYAIGDRTSLRFIRLTERFVPNIGLMAIGFTGGQVLKTAAFRAQTVGA
jgi:HK97 family phage major capsid protein